MSFWMQALTTGILEGMIYVLIGIGLYLVFSVMRVVNFAHGFFVLIGMYVVLWAAPSTFTAFIGITLVAAVAAAVFGLLVERTLIEPTLNKPGHAQLVITISLGIVMQYAAQIMFPEPYQTVSNPWPFEALNLFGVTIGSARLSAGVISLVLTFGVAWLIYRTRFGSLMRACSQSIEGAIHMGINYPGVYRSTFALGSGLAAIAGGLLIPFQPVSPHLGLDLTVKAFLVVVIGGTHSIWGTVIAGILLGVFESLGSVLLSGSLTTTVIYAAFLLVILLRPQGLITSKPKLRVSQAPKTRKVVEA